MRTFHFTQFVAISALIISGCSDGSESRVKTGFLVDTYVSGIAYATASHEGLTDSKGSFKYLAGETVMFSLGDTLLGEVQGKRQVTPFDLANAPVIVDTSALAKALKNPRDAFHRVVNTAVLLQSLDSDADLDNGIEITADVVGLFRGVELDLDRHWSIFAGDFELRRAIAQANALGLFEVTHGLVTEAMAADHLYRSLQVDPQIYARNFEQLDENADGVPDEIQSWEFDGNGNLTRYQADGGADGTIDHVMSYSYDANGRRSRVGEDNTGDGIFRLVEEREYDAIGNLVRFVREGEEFGVLEFFHYFDLGYDTSGNRTNEVSGRIIEGEITVDNIVTRQFDDFGDVTRVEVDVNEDGVADYIESWQYDARGNTTRHDIDQDGDGTPESTEIWQFDGHDNVTLYEDRSFGFLTSWDNDYDDQGQLVRSRQSEGLEQAPLNDTRYFYDADGRLVREESIREVGSRVEFLVISTFEYDAAGNLVRETYDMQGWGARRHMVVEEYDSYGNLTLEQDVREIVGGPSDVVSAIVSRTRSWDEQGRRTTRNERDTDADGMPDEIVIFKVDEHGNLTEEYEDLDGDGVPEELGLIDYNYTLDDKGNLVGEEVDEGADGVIEIIAEYRYESTGWGHLFSRE